MDLAALHRTRRNLVERLNAERVAGGWWEGRLASSALSTATAIGALALASDHDVTPGLDWLAKTQNEDGGWGDTVLSLSNISTTVLCWCSFAISGTEVRYQASIKKAEAWLTNAAGGTDAPRLTKAVLHRYGTDRTFSVPILTVMAIAEDPVYLNEPFVVTTSFKKEPNNSKWHPTPCEIAPPAK